MKSKGASVRAHDVIPYILCVGADGKGARSAQADHAFHPDDLRRQGSVLRIDYDLYLDGQVLQPVLRLCENIEGTERARLAECLGLDPGRYTTSAAEIHERTFHRFESQIPDSDRFKDAVPLAIGCPSCNATFSFEGVESAATEADGATLRPNGIVCPSCSVPVPTPSFTIQLETAVRSFISQYYLGWGVCDGDDCGARTRAMSVYGRRCLGLAKPGCKGMVRLEVSPRGGASGCQVKAPLIGLTWRELVGSSRRWGGGERGDEKNLGRCERLRRATDEAGLAINR